MTAEISVSRESRFENVRRIQLRVHKQYPSLRLDKYLVKRLSCFSRAFLQRLIREGRVQVEGQKVKPSTTVTRGARIDLDIPLPDRPRVAPEEIPLDILYEDPHLLVLNKPAGLVVHPAPGHMRGTMANALMHHCGWLPPPSPPPEERMALRRGGLGSIHDDVYRPGIVHRIDQFTSGILVAAKDEIAHHTLANQFQKRTVEKRYLALVEGCPELDADSIDLPIGKHPRDFKKMAVRQDGKGKPALTMYRVTERYAGRYALLEIELKTGRTHQIRVHLAARGWPVLCDAVYGRSTKLCLSDLTRGKGNLAEQPRDLPDEILQRQALHAFRIGFKHPVYGEFMTFEAELPDDMSRTREILRMLH